MHDSPKHIAIIMDGNRRWAKKRGMPVIAGHRQGIKSIETILKAAKAEGVKVLTLYTFSTENWKRPKKETDALMGLLEQYLEKEHGRLIRNNIRFETIGRTDRFTEGLLKKIRKVKDLTKENDSLTLNLALDYGSRYEILESVRNLARDVKESRIKAGDISEELFSGYLYTKDLPDPDLLIRTGGEFRLSNFLLWQLSYSEIYVTRKFWPDFGQEDFKKAIEEYKKRERRTGG